MLSLIPSTSIKGYPLYVDEYEENGKRYLRVWYHHPRGAARQLELKRYVDISKLGQLLGQLQAEGDKNSERIAFKNTSIFEHTDFVSSLRELGVTNITARCTFNPSKITEEKISAYTSNYTCATRIPVTSLDALDEMKGAIAAYTHVRSVILARILFFTIGELRSGRIQNRSLRRNFIAKLLSGDGSLGARRTTKRLDVRLTVVDKDIEALHDYAILLEQEGFKAKVLTDRITVRAYCTFLNLLRLYEIGAFRNSKNWIRLICAIKITLMGRENCGYKRIQALSTLGRITSDEVSARYRIGRRAANLWIHTMERKNLLESIRQATRVQGRKNYQISAKGKDIAQLIKTVERDYDEIAAHVEFNDPESLLRSTKTKGRKGPMKAPIARLEIQAHSGEHASNHGV